jgi:hypothetical protein
MNDLIVVCGRELEHSGMIYPDYSKYSIGAVVEGL